MATITNTVTKYISGGIDAVTEFKMSINSDNARRKVDGRVEARLIELAKVILETPVGREAIRNALKKQTSTSQKRLLVYPDKRRPGIHSPYEGCP